MANGSDHKPVALSFTGRVPRESSRRRKKFYRDVDWEKIREVIGSRLEDGNYMMKITDTTTLDRIAGILLNGIRAVLGEHVSRAEESPYAKRRWSRELSTLRTDFTTKRNRITTLSRRGEDTIMHNETPVHQGEFGRRSGFLAFGVVLDPHTNQESGCSCTFLHVLASS
jgi:hypothetical protein